MRIGIDARLLQSGQGIGRYIHELITHLLLIDSGDEYVFFLNDTNWHEVEEHPRVTKVRANIPWYSFAEQIILPFLIAREKLDLMHFPHMNVPILYPGPFVITVHDLILIKHPKSATSAASTRAPLVHAVKYWAYQISLVCALRRARRIMTVSEWVKKDLMALFHLASEKITVTYEGADISQGKEEEGVSSMIAKPFLLYAGNLFPHKNPELLLDLAEKLKGRGMRLVMVGQENFFQKKFVGTVKTHGLEKTVLHLGKVDDSRLKGLYNQAFAYVFPSFEEGFGLPALEAMQNGLPVLASNSSCLPEILGDAALFFDPNSIDALYNGLEMLMNNPSLRTALIERGYARAALYRWEDCARNTLNVYHL